MSPDSVLLGDRRQGIKGKSGFTLKHLRDAGFKGTAGLPPES
jgi:hypothetical protein